MMKIELLKQGKFTTSGSSVLKMMQNNNMPSLDLLVRESIQNSLDAALPFAQQVGVHFQHGKFDKNDFFDFLPSLNNNVIQKINVESDFISITDINTYGLTGNLDGIYKPDETKQNLGKLVFHIMKAQENENAGGSWGIGKTVYYRMGIGIVVFYSRVKLDDGNFQERLVAALVENETKNDGLLSNYNGNNGVAFFGDECENGVQAITDPQIIHKFLNIFKITPLNGLTTGTTIIIPFIDIEKLLNNSITHEDTENWWQKELSDYLEISILRWYFPRMVSNYPYGPKLSVFINKKEVQVSAECPIFAKLKELYSCCYNKGSASEWIKKVDIVRKTNMKDTVLGTFAYGTISKSELKMTKAHLPSPYKYLLIDVHEDLKNVPIIAFCRRPGMIVNYDCAICSNGVTSDKDEYIVGVFALNSENVILQPSTINLDEYIRQGEKSDHTSWEDHPIEKNTGKIQIVKLIQNQIGKVLKKEFDNDQTVAGDGNMMMGLASKFGKLLLPSTGFGKHGFEKTSGKSPHIKKGGGIVKIKDKNLVLFEAQTFKGGTIFLDYTIRILSKNRKIIFENVIETINGSISPIKWEESVGEYPCEIDKLAFKNKDKNNPYQVFVSPKETNVKFCDYDITFQRTSSGKCYGFTLERKEGSNIEFWLKISLTTNDRLVKTNFEINLTED